MVCGICHFPSAPEDCEIFLSAILFCTLGKTTGIHILRFTPICFQNLSGVPGFSGKLWEFVFSVCSQFVGCVVFGDDRLEFRKFGVVCVSGSPKYRLYIPGTDMLFFGDDDCLKFLNCMVCAPDFLEYMEGGISEIRPHTKTHLSLPPKPDTCFSPSLSHLLFSSRLSLTCFSLPLSLALLSFSLSM